MTFAEAGPVGWAAILAGPAVGAFLAVLADRLPRGEDVVFRPSACRGCGRRLGWREKIPLVSWLVQRGRCRGCGAAIPRSLPETELAGLAAPLLALWVSASPAQMALGAVFLWCLLGLALCDLAAYRLPDALTAALALAGLGLALEDPARGAADAALGAGAGAGAFWLLRLAYARLRGREGLGLGDVKLMGGIGAALGAPALPLVTLAAALSALAVAVAAGLRRGRRASGSDAAPFGAHLAAAAGAVWLAGL